MRRPHRGISDGNTNGNSLEKNVCISSCWMFASDSVSLPRLENPTGACPTHRRQWADFLVSLMAPLHRQYKTARTETRRHLLLKIRQMPTQTSASRGYVLFNIKMAFMPSVVWCRKGHTQKSYKLSSGMQTWPAEYSKLGKTRIIKDANIWLVRNATFFDPNFQLHSIRNRKAWLLILLLLTAKGAARFMRQPLLFYQLTK